LRIFGGEILLFGESIHAIRAYHVTTVRLHFNFFIIIPPPLDGGWVAGGKDFGVCCRCRLGNVLKIENFHSLAVSTE